MWLKSKRSRLGPTSEPFWATWVPSTFAQGAVEEVGGGVVAAGAVAQRRVDRGLHGVAGGDGAHPVVQMQARGLLRVGHHEGSEGAGVAHLAAALAVEGGAVEHHDCRSRRAPAHGLAPPGPGPACRPVPRSGCGLRPARCRCRECRCSPETRCRRAPRRSVPTAGRGLPGPIPPQASRPRCFCSSRHSSKRALSTPKPPSWHSSWVRSKGKP